MTSGDGPAGRTVRGFNPVNLGALVGVVAEVDGQRRMTSGFAISRTPTSDIVKMDGKQTAREELYSFDQPSNPVRSREVTQDLSSVDYLSNGPTTQVGDCNFCELVVGAACLVLSQVDEAACIAACGTLSVVPPAGLGCAIICAALISTAVDDVLVCAGISVFGLCAAAGYCE